MAAASSSYSQAPARVARDRGRDPVGTDLAGAAQDLDLARRLDHPQAVEARRQVAQRGVGVAAPDRLDLVGLLARLAAPGVLLPAAQVEALLVAGQVEFVALAESHPEQLPALAGHSAAPPGQVLGQVGEVVDLETAAFGLLGCIQPVRSIDELLAIALVGQVEPRFATVDLQQQRRVPPFVAGQVEEVVVLPEAGTVARHRLREQEDRASFEPLAEPRPGAR